ncbi:hypothetical protein [Paludisphaera rhizosphaerae]|uniref:hypothetical protein n=1 Tax=Paludisphaera rhizosphaerae TaxID=2711216 RepID=UPI0013EBE7CE|nr:hypothetical protein [Paludisphaera rhizosphaerae]
MLDRQVQLSEPRRMIHRRFLRLASEGGATQPSGLAESFATIAIFTVFLALILLKAPGVDYYLTSRDHGYQLAIGGQALLGKTPGLDIVTVYGPMAMLTSALGLRLSGSLWGETLLCAGGYSLCFTLLYSLSRREWSRWAGVASAIVGYVLMARYYKWYVWLIPLATLWSIQGWLYAADDRKRSWLAASGAIVGLGWLFRLDMGTFAGAAVSAMIAFVELRRDRREFVRSSATFLSVAACFPIGWLIYLAYVGGLTAPWQFLASSLHGALVVSRGMAAPMAPLFAIQLGYASAALILGIALLVGLVRSWRRGATPKSLFLLASALVGLAVVHQAMHRRDPAHLLQVIPPVIVAAFELLGMLRTAAIDPTNRPSLRASAATCGLLAGGVLAYAAYGMTPYSRWDLVPIGPTPGARLAGLARPLEFDAPATAVARYLREQTAPNDSVLVFPLDSQLLTIAQRPMSGRLHGYYAGVFDAPEDAAANLAAIQADPPAVVIVPSSKCPPNGSAWPSDDLARRGKVAHAYLDRYIRENYPKTVYDDGRSAVLTR